MISTVVYTASCHPVNAELLYILSSRVFSIEQESIKQDTRHLMPYGLVQYTTTALCKQQMLQHNIFFHNLAIILIFNIKPTIMYSDFLFALSKDHRVKVTERITCGT